MTVDPPTDEKSRKFERTGTSVFVSYSRRNGDELGLIEPILRDLAQIGIIDVFIDNQITTGSAWRRTIDTALNSMDIAILIITKDFLKSQFIRDVELNSIRKRAKARRILVIPIYFEACDLGDQTWILEYQAPADLKLPVADMTDHQRTGMIADITDQIKLFAFRNTRIKRFVRRRIANWRFSVPAALTTLSLCITLFFLSWRQMQPVLIRQIARTVPTSSCTVEQNSSSIQLFENGWLLANFKDDKFYAIAKRDNDGIEWIAEPASGYTKGGSEPCDDIAGEDKLRLGFRWLYCRSSRSKEVRGMLGKPMTGEIRIWAQYQNWLGSKLIYGLPSTKQGAEFGQFQVLSGVTLQNSENVKGVGRMFGYTIGADTQSEYCTAIWHAAKVNGEYHKLQENMLDSEYCKTLIGKSEYLPPRRACSLSGYSGR